MPVGFSTRAEHIAWAKARALEYMDAGEVQTALLSLSSDLGKHPETAEKREYTASLLVLWSGHHVAEAKVRSYIEGLA